MAISWMTVLAAVPWTGVIKHAPKEPELKSVDDDFDHLFGSWFNRGFLVLRPIDWSSPADILERLIRYEAVHAIQGWDDLAAASSPPTAAASASSIPR